MRSFKGKNKFFLACRLFAMLLILVTVFVVPSYAQVKWPNRLVIAAPSAGTTNYMIAVGMGETIKKHTPIKVVQVLPLGGPTVWGPMMRSGQVDLAIQSGANVIDLFSGKGEFEKMGPVPVSTLIGGHPFPLMFHTTPDKNIKTGRLILKNKVVYTTMMGQPMFLQIAQAQLASAGLTLKDLKSSSTMPSVAQATNQLIEGRVDAFIYPVVSVSVHQINQAKGETVFVNLSSEQADYVEKRNPGYYKTVIPVGKYANKKEMRYAIAFQTCACLGLILTHQLRMNWLRFYWRIMRSGSVHTHRQKIGGLTRNRDNCCGTLPPRSN